MCDIFYLIAKYYVLVTWQERSFFVTYYLHLKYNQHKNNKWVRNWWWMAKGIDVSELWVGLQTQFFLCLSLRIHVRNKEFNSIPLIRYHLFHGEYQWVKYSLVPSQRLKLKYYIHLTAWICTTLFSFLW